MTTTSRRLPGIQVDVAPPPPLEALPRMDVAVFVGFAATGPLHVPVAVEGVAQYTAVFGADARLAWDARQGEAVRAHLGPCIRAFFAGGGRRCWVVRVARTAALLRATAAGGGDEVVATANRFEVAGMLQATAGGDAIEPAQVQARCEGSWSDGLRVGTALQRERFVIADAVAAGAPSAADLEFTTPQGLAAGDLLQVGTADRGDLYATVSAVLGTAGAGRRVQARWAGAFTKLAAGSLAADLRGFARTAGDDGRRPATLLAAPRGDDFVLRLDDGAAAASRPPGHWVRLDASDGRIVWLRADEVDRQPAPHSSPDDSPAAGARVLTVVNGPAWLQTTGAAQWAAAAPPTRADRLTFDLRVTDGAALDSRLVALSLTPQADRHFWLQQTDADFHAPRDGLDTPQPAGGQRFPLAPLQATAADGSPAAGVAAWLPLGIDTAFGAALAALPAPGTALERDGLARFDAGLFVDPELASDRCDDLLAHAEDIRLLRDRPRPLFGLHAALGIGAGGLVDEASLLALPDAVHLGWRRRGDDDDPADRLSPQPPAAPPQWAAHRGACAPAVAPLLDGPDFGVFLDCGTRRLAAPRLDGPPAGLASGDYRLHWTDSEPGADYRLFEASRADFADEREIARGPATDHVVRAQRDGRYHHRVLAERAGERSAPSNAVVVRLRAEDWVQLEPDVAELAVQPQWLAVHHAALRLAAASGELFVALSMPRHYRSAQALRHAARLRTTVAVGLQTPERALATTEARALSHGALYFPWLQAEARPPLTADAAVPAAGASRITPPDGVALAVLASRALHRGAWVAAANEPMPGVLALVPDVAAADRQALQDGRVNLLRADPRGFFALSADTLALDDALRPVNVRRLLILLRRLALRRGTAYVFEPNGATLRRAVQRGFDSLLTDLYQRGAFAGASAAESFRVVTDDTIATALDRDAGRFLVELWVAPALPMRFLAVRLAQSGDRLSVIEQP